MEGPLLDAPLVGPIPTMRYCRNFLSAAEQDSLAEKVLSSKSWVQLKNRRLQQWGGTPEEKGMVASRLPEWLEALGCKLVAFKCVEAQPNHVLINEYLPGQGIVPHEDGPLYLPHFAIVSLLTPLLLDFYRKLDDERPQSLQERRVCSLCLEPGSLLIISEEAYTGYLHGIAERTQDVLDESVCNVHLIDPQLREQRVIERQQRLSLTIRTVKKTVKLSKLFGAKK
jgi:alkylated DNA repair protein alkB family protein 6